MGYLHIQADGQGRAFNPIPTSVFFEDSSMELVLPPQNLMGVDVSRKIYANTVATLPTHDVFLRYLEILTNNTAGPLTVDVIIGGNLGSGVTTNVVGSANGDLLAEGGIDNWFITGDSTAGGTFGDPILAHLLDGNLAMEHADAITMTTATLTGALDYSATGSTTPYFTNTLTATLLRDDVLYAWTGLSLEPGETKILMHLEIMTLDNAPGVTDGLTGAITSAWYLESMPPILGTNMDANEINAVVNFPAAHSICNVVGSINSVTPNALVTVQNLTLGTSAQSYSLTNGSFGVCLDAVAGDALEVTDGVGVWNFRVR